MAGGRDQESKRGEMWQTMSGKALASKFGTDLKKGLSAEGVKASRDKYGANELSEEEKESVWELILEQFDDLLVKILLVSALISFVLAFFEDGDDNAAFVEPFVIFLILIINAAVGVWQELNAEKALAALKALQPSKATVIRDGETSVIDTVDVVPGDLVEFAVGEKVPADIRLTEKLTQTVRIDESSLTGESVVVFKENKTLRAKKSDKKDQPQPNMAYSGTAVAGGRARGVVVATGMNTRVGAIQADINRAEKEKKEGQEKSPLKEKLDDFGTQLSYVIGAICLLVWVMNYKKFSDPVHGSAIKGCIYYLKIAVALGVAAIPEGLPAVITLCLALGTRRMAKRKAIIRKLGSVETLGCTTVICSDKTGTLTMNAMTCVELAFLGETKTDQRQMRVTGELGYNPEGSVEHLDYDDEENLINIQRVCVACNEAIQIGFDEKTQKNVLVRGTPTEASLLILAEKMGLPSGEELPEGGDSTLPVSDYINSKIQRIATLEFDRNRKSMSVLVKVDGQNMLLCKGAPEKIVKRCSKIMVDNGDEEKLGRKEQRTLLSLNNEMAARPLRVLGLAIKTKGLPKDLADMKVGGTAKSLESPDNYEGIESDMTFLGFAGIKDPARPEVKESIQKCNDAGVRVIMITGDKKETAEAIGREIGLLDQDESVEGKSFDGEEFVNMDEKEQAQVMTRDHTSRIFSRTAPAAKMAIVNLLKRNGEIAAMTGDGVNDAPALKAAHIGIAMGIAGTSVAKETSDMILADDNFSTIVAAVEEGRSIYQNMKAFIRYLISSNIGEVASIFLTAFFGLPEGLIPVQLLWVNLVTDGPPATALGFNPVDPDIMKQKPRSKTEDLITRWVFFRYMVIGIYVGLATVGIFAYWFCFYDYAADGHTMVSIDQLRNWGQCVNGSTEGLFAGFTVNDFDVGGTTMSFSDDPCAYFTRGKVKASTLSLSVLVAIEMFNALNALSEDGSLFHIPPWANPYLLLAMALSFAMHFVILYVPWLASIFQIAPLDWTDWKLVLYFSLPVILIDEVLKFAGRQMSAAERARRKKDE